MTVGVNGNVKYGDCSSMKEEDKLESILITAAKGLFNLVMHYRNICVLFICLNENTFI